MIPRRRQKTDEHNKRTSQAGYDITTTLFEPPSAEKFTKITMQKQHQQFRSR